jgi:CheY-like chemotaxis protein
MKILIVEDESLVALLIEDMLETLGHEPLGPVATVGESLTLIPECDMVILDVNLDGENSLEIADVLMESGKPFAFSSGYNSATIGEKYINVPLLSKPFGIEEVEQLFQNTLTN